MSKKVYCDVSMCGLNHDTESNISLQ